MKKTGLYGTLNSLRDKKWFGTLSHRALRVLVVLLTYYNWQEHAAWPGMRTLIEQTGLSKRSIQYAIRELCDLNLLTVVAARGRRTNRYCLSEAVPNVPADSSSPARITQRRALQPPTNLGVQSDAPISRAVEAQTVAPQRSNSWCTSEVQNAEPAILNNEVNNEENYISVSSHKPPSKDRNQCIAEYRQLFDNVRQYPGSAAGIRRALAKDLDITEDEAAALLDGVKQSANRDFLSPDGQDETKS